MMGKILTLFEVRDTEPSRMPSCIYTIPLEIAPFNVYQCRTWENQQKHPGGLMQFLEIDFVLVTGKKKMCPFSRSLFCIVYFISIVLSDGWQKLFCFIGHFLSGSNGLLQFVWVRILRIIGCVRRDVATYFWNKFFIQLYIFGILHIFLFFGQ